MLKKILVFISIFLFMVIALVGIAIAYYFYSLTPFTTGETPAVTIKLQVPSGRSVRSVAKELADLGIIRSEYMFYGAARLSDLQIKAGTYSLSSGMSVREIFNQLQTGKQDYLSVSIPEGLTISKIAKLLEEKGVVDSQSFVEVARDPLLLNEFKIPADNFEGYIFPDTYFFNPGMDAESVLRMMVYNFYDKIESMDILAAATADQLFHVVKLASIVEREYRVAEEAPLIASVFSNRLDKGIGLYSCATIEYIITEIEGRPHPDVITNNDLKINSPYNTYLWAGLPPGPISNPGLVALKAAANPPKTPYYYFRLTDPQQGTHHFSEGFDEHIDAGKIYTKKAAVN